jgi:hypothetical protein
VTTADQIVVGVTAARMAGDLLLGYAQRGDRSVHLDGVVPVSTSTAPSRPSTSPPETSRNGSPSQMTVTAQA